MNDSKVLKMIIVVLLVIIIVLYFLAGCGTANASEPIPNQRMKIERYALDGVATHYIFTDLETGVQYLSVYRCGTCVIVDKDGNPYLANGWRDYE